MPCVKAAGDTAQTLALLKGKRLPYYEYKETGVLRSTFVVLFDERFSSSHERRDSMRERKLLSQTGAAFHRARTRLNCRTTQNFVDLKPGSVAYESVRVVIVARQFYSCLRLTGAHIQQKPALLCSIVRGFQKKVK